MKSADRFLSPQLAKYEIHVPAQVVMSFLGDLRQPVIPRCAWKAFVDSADASRTSRADRLKLLINGLPPENRETLKFILGHLQRVTSNRYSKLNITAAATIFAPLLMGKTDDLHMSNILVEILSFMLRLEPEFFEASPSSINVSCRM